MNSDTLISLVVGIVTIVGVVMTIQWLYFKPKVAQLIDEEIKECKDHREKETGAILKRIEEKVDTVITENRYIRKRVDTHINGSDNHGRQHG